MSSTIELKVAKLCGDTFSVFVKPDSIVLGVKINIMWITKIPYEQQHLIFVGDDLGDFRKLSSYNIQDQANLTLVVSKNSDGLGRLANEPGQGEFAPH